MGFSRLGEHLARTFFWFQILEKGPVQRVTEEYRRSTQVLK